MARNAILLRAALVVSVVAVSGCATPAASPAFDPSSACVTDGRRPGAYPELEALLPAALDGVAPDSVDSGRSCSEGALGSLYAQGVRELRFAGATWQLGGEKGATRAVFEGAGVDPSTLIEFYASGARATGRAEALDVRPYEVEGQPGTRMDTIHRSVGQTIIAWPADDGGRVNVLLTSAMGESELEAVLAELGS